MAALIDIATVCVCVGVGVGVIVWGVCGCGWV